MIDHGDFTAWQNAAAVNAESAFGLAREALVLPSLDGRGGAPRR